MRQRANIKFRFELGKIRLYLKIDEKCILMTTCLKLEFKSGSIVNDDKIHDCSEGKI